MNCVLLCVLMAAVRVTGAEYYGRRVGALNTLAHDVSGNVFVMDERRLMLRHFTYDGQGPDAFFYLGTNGSPSGQGLQIPDEKNSMAVLSRYNNAVVILTIPDGLMSDGKQVTTANIAWLSVWCRQFAVDFGHILFPADLQIPAPVNVGTFKTLAHGVSSDEVLIKDSRTIVIPNFKYDGTGPDAYFYVGKSASPDASGMIIANEKGSKAILGRYDGEDLTLVLDEAAGSWPDYRWLSVWCEQFTVDFGHVLLPQNMIVPVYMESEYYGTRVGEIKTLAHQVAGTVFVMDEYRIMIRHFSYDGTGPDAFFYVGTSGAPSGTGKQIPDENGSMEILSKYTNDNLVLTIPRNLISTDGKQVTTANIAWLSVWCRQFAVDFGHILFPAGLAIPAPVTVGAFKTLAHGVSSGVVMIKDTRTIVIPNFSYDGQGPDAYFYVGKSASPDNSGTIIGNEQNSKAILGRYDGEDLTLVLDEAAGSWPDYRWLSVWCEQFTVDFGHVLLPQNMLLPPFVGEQQLILDNCEQLHDHLTVAWAIKDEYITIELSGALEDNGYMSFGLSGSEKKTDMGHADVSICYYDDTKGPMAEDYYIQSYSLCSGSSGVCPDKAFDANNDLEVMSGSLRQGVTTVRYRRKLDTADGTNTDLAFKSGTIPYIVWALGKRNEQGQVVKHNFRTRGDVKINFHRPAANQCSGVKPLEQKAYQPWAEEVIYGDRLPLGKVITARMGLAGGARGYSAITGHQSWGIAWYLNDKLIPTLVLRRGETFTFKVEGGNDPALSAEYHPLYITSDKAGGYAGKVAADQTREQLYAGVSGGQPQQGAVGRLCEYKVSQTTKAPEEYEKFEEYFSTLQLECKDGEPGMFTWTPDRNTPDEVYYQCFTHQHLGWKIHVVDSYIEYRYLKGSAPNTTTLGLVLTMSLAFLIKLLF